MFVEQAIFTSARTSRLDGYQLVATSPGVCDADAKELAAWGPAHDSLPAAGAKSSVNFHRLAGGTLCVSKTTTAGPEYSGRRGERVYTQCLLPPAELFARFGNNPFRLLEAASAAGQLQVLAHIPKRLEPFPLPGRASAVDRTQVQRSLSGDRGPLAGLLRALLDGKRVAVVCDGRGERLVAGLINLLPPECRIEVPFSTGLRPSSRRPLRVCAIPNDAELIGLVRRQPDTLLWDTTSPSPEPPANAWFSLLTDLVARGRLSDLTTILGVSNQSLCLENLEAFAVETRNRLEQRGTGPPAFAPATAPNAESGQGETGATQRAHAPHRRFAKSTADTSDPNVPPNERPAAMLDLQCGPLLDKLHTLDDAVYAAIEGDRAQLAEVERLWKELAAELSPELAEESREQYLHYALSQWLAAGQGGCNRDPQKAAVVLDVLCGLFELG